MEKSGIQVADELVINKIYFIRGEKVMLDSDLATLYGVDTKRLNEQIKRNLKRFPADFIFQLTKNEFNILKSQIATSSWGGKRKLPYVFTELGIAMLSSVLNSDKAIEVNIQIMRVFTRLRKALLDNVELRLAIEELKKKTDNNTKNIEIVFAYFDELMQKNEPKPEKRKIGF